MTEKATYDGLKQRVMKLEQEVSRLRKAEERLRENETKYRTLFHQFGAGIYLHDLQGRIVDVNQAACQQTGYAKDELLQLEIFDLHPEEPKTGHPSREEILRQWHRWKPEQRFVLEAAHKRKDGSVFPIELSASVMHYGGKHFIIAIVQDITDRKQAEKARRESERFLQQVFESIQDGISVLDTDFTVIKTNRWMEQMYASATPLVGKKCYRVYQQRNSPCPWCPTRKTVETGETKTEIVPYPTPGNPTGWIELSAFPVKDTGGAVVRVIEYVKDITQRRTAEKELRDLNETMDLAQKMAGIGYWSYDIKEDKRFWSTQMYENFGLDPASGPPRMEDIRKAFHPEDRDRYERNLADAIQGAPYDQIARILMPNGDIHYVRTQGYPRKSKAGDVVGLFGTSQDITERVMSEKALRESEENYRRIFENSVVGFFQSTPKGRFIRVNTAFAKMLRYESPEALLTEIIDIENQYYVNVADRRQYQKILQEQGYVESFEVKVKRKDGSQMWVSSSTRAYFNERGKVLRYEGINVDITHRKRAEKEKEALQAQLQQAQKFEAIGTLAGGIAHDFNNLLMGIQGRASLMAAGLGAHHPLMEHIQGIEAYVQNATDLTKQMLGFARGGKYEVKPVDMNELVNTSAAMFGRTRKEIRIHTHKRQEAVVAEVDKKQIEQVMLNLFVNAWQAMPEGGDLFIETDVLRLDPEASQPYPIEPGAYAFVSVTDTGFGMNESTRQRIFDPFFTTKEKGRGTGLGLASAYGIVKNHGGMITVQSEVGVGSTFSVYLPASKKPAKEETTPDGELLSGSETVLLVDDEEMIVDVAQGMLKKLGYRVVTARGGEQAIEAVSRVGNEIDLVLLDLIMPGMDGGKVFDEIRSLQPRLPILLSSGYAMDGQATKIMEKGCNGFLQKPFNLSELSRKIREILDQAGDVE